MANITKFGYSAPAWKPAQPFTPARGRTFNPENPLYSAVLGQPESDPFGASQQSRFLSASPQQIPATAAGPAYNQPPGQQALAPPGAQPQQPPADGGPANIDYTSDPILQKIQALAQMDMSNAQAQATSLRKQALIDFGDADFARKILPDDPMTADAAGQNPFGVAKRLRKRGDDETRNAEEGYNKANLFYSGARSQGLSDLAQTLLEREADAQSAVTGILSDIQSNLLSAQQNARLRTTDAESDAFARMLSAILSGGGGGAAAGAGAPAAPDPENPMDNWVDLLLAGTGPSRWQRGNLGPF